MEWLLFVYFYSIKNWIEANIEEFQRILLSAPYNCNKASTVYLNEKTESYHWCACFCQWPYKKTFFFSLFLFAFLRPFWIHIWKSKSHYFLFGVTWETLILLCIAINICWSFFFLVVAESESTQVEINIKVTHNKIQINWNVHLCPARFILRDVCTIVCSKALFNNRYGGQTFILIVHFMFSLCKLLLWLLLINLEWEYSFCM